MKAAIVSAAGRSPVYGDFAEPSDIEGREVITVSTSALSQFSKSRSSGSHYSSEGGFPAIAGSDGVGRSASGKRLYFLLPVHPYGALAEKTLIRPELSVSVPDELDDVTAAAIANPGMSAWAALIERAVIKPGEVVLINGANGSAGRLAVQLAKHLGAGKVIATGRNEAELEELKSIGADVVVPFSLGPLQTAGEKHYEDALKKEIAQGLNIVLDYLWGDSARTIMAAIARTVEDTTPVRFVHIGGASGKDSIDLPGAALRSSSIQLMGSGVKSVPLERLLDAVGKVFKVTKPADLRIATRTMRLADIEAAWKEPGKPRVVVQVF